MHPRRPICGRCVGRHSGALGASDTDRLYGTVVAPILRAMNEAGDVWDDPSEDMLFMLVEELRNPGNAFLIVERLEAGRAGHFMQVVAPESSGSHYVLEYREGSPETHRGTSNPSMRVVHETLTRWAHDLPGWRERHTWQPVVY